VFLALTAVSGLLELIERIIKRFPDVGAGLVPHLLQQINYWYKVPKET
jgi:hypothetical protein